MNKDLIAYIKELDEESIRRYNERFEKFGVEAKTLGWGSKSDQLARFEAAVRFVDLSKKTVLDIGCGFSDFYDFLLSKNINPKKYKGIDINNKLVEVASKKFPGNEYEVKNILLNNYNSVQADIVVMFGILNFKLNKMDNLDYTEKMIIEAWKITKEVLVVDFLSTHLVKSYPKEGFVYYHDPKDVLDICFKLTNDISLLHNYPAIPQKEFMVILHKSEKDENI